MGLSAAPPDGTGYNDGMKRYLKLALSLLLPLFVVSCAPGVTSLVNAPTFRVVESDTALVRLEPTGVGSGAALIHLEIEARNPNPFAVQLAALDGDFFLGESRVASSSFRNGVSLPARGTGRFGLDVEVPVSGAPQLLTQLARLVGGQGVSYRMNATVTVDVLGSPQRFPSLTVAQGELKVPGGLRPPTVRLDASASEVRLSGLTVLVDVGLMLDNPLPIGYWVSGPRVGLSLDGRPVGSASLPRVPVEANSASRAALRFELGLADVGAAMMARLQSGGTSGLRLGLDGNLNVEIPGISSLTRPLGDVEGVLR